MKECDNSEIYISSKFVLCICLLIILDTSFKTTYSDGNTFICSIIVCVFETDRQRLVTHAQCVQSYQLAFQPGI